jgi:acyl carrier protein
VRPRTNFEATWRYRFIVGIFDGGKEKKMFTKIQRLIAQHASLAVPAACLTPRANLYDLGLTAFDAIRLLVAVEGAFKVEFPREMLKRESAASIEAIVMTIRAARRVHALEAMREAA